jgi:biotin carboxylase
MKILFLGAARHQVPALEAALRLGFEVYTADNLPTNPGHRLAREAFEVNAADPDAVEALARKLEVQGVLGYASEVCARTAAVVAGRLGLPGAHPAAVLALSHKDAFREITAADDLQPVAWQRFEVHEGGRAAAWARQRGGAVVVKPVDCSGGRGVTVGPGDFDEAFARAARASRLGRVIVEERVSPCGGQFGGDGWMEEGGLRFLCCYDNCTLPPPDNGAAIQETFPSRNSPEQLAVLHAHLERLLQACGYADGPFNFDGCFLENGRPFVFEVAPRNGGNFIPQMVCRHTGVDLTTAVVLAAVQPGHRLHLPDPGPPVPLPCHATWVVHARRAGLYQGVTLSAELGGHVLEHVPYVEPGERVRAFSTSGDALGILMMEFTREEEMHALMARMDELCQIKLEPMHE